MKMLNFIGSDSGFGAKNTSAYIELNNKFILIDCGFTVFGEIKDKFNFSKFDSIDIIITHLHNDHAGSLSQFISYSYFIYNKKINVISNCKNIQKYLDITGVPKEAYEIKNKTEYLEFIKTSHTKDIDSYGFKLTINNKKIIYTGDTNTIEPFLSYIEHIDEMYIDTSKSGGVHIKIENVIDVLKNISKKGIDVYLMHLDDKNYIKHIIKDTNIKLAKFD